MQQNVLRPVRTGGRVFSLISVSVERLIGELSVSTVKKTYIRLLSLQLCYFCGRNVPVFTKQTEFQWWLQLHW